MAQAEKYAWGSLATMSFVFWFAAMRLTDGWTIPEQTPGRLFEVYVIVILLAVALETVLATIVALQSRKHDIEKDERDHAIEKRATVIAFYFLVAALNVLIVQAILEKVYTQTVFPESPLAALNLARPEALFFMLFALITGAHLVQRLAIIVQYRFGIGHAHG